MTMPPLPPGFVLEPDESDIPPLPPGFVMDSDDDGGSLELDIVGGTPVSSQQFEQENPTDGMSGLDRFAAGVGKSVVDTGHGLKQVGTSMAEYFVRSNPVLFNQRSMSSLVTGEDDSTAGKLRASLARQYEEAEERKRRDAPLTSTGAGMAGNIVGTVGQILGPGVVLRGTAAGAALLPRTIGGNALQGAAFGASQPVSSDAGRVGSIALGGITGGAGAAAPKAISGIASLARNAMPAVSRGAQTRAAADVLNKFAADPAALRAGATSPQTLVAGSQPTLAEASGDVGLAGLQRTLANTPEFGNAFTQRQQANNLARVSAIEGAFGGADDAAAAAIRSTRDQAARTILKPIEKTPIGRGKKELTPEDFAAFAQERQRAYIASERAKLQSIASGRSTPDQAALPPSQRIGAGEAAEQLSRLDEMEAAIPSRFAADSDSIQLGFPAWKATQDAGGIVSRGDLSKVTAGVNRLAEKHQASPAVRQAMDAVKAEIPNIRTVGDAHAVRQYIGQLIGGQVEGKAGAKLAKRELMTVQGLLDREMRAAYPEWGRFLREYKGLSREADQVSVGAELLGTGRAVRSATNDPSLTPAAFGRAAGNLDRTVQRATGFNRASASKTLTQPQREVVDAVRRDLERYSRASTDGKAIGSNTVQNAIGGNTFQSAVGPVGAAVFEPISGVALLGLNQMRGKFGGQVAGLVEEAMLDPSRAAEILAAVPPWYRAAVIRDAAPLITRASSVSGVVAPTLAE